MHSRALLLSSALAIGLFVASQSQARQTETFPARGAQPLVISPQGSEHRLYSQSAALVVSASGYAGGVTGWASLPATPTEMDDIRDVLVRQGFEVTRVYDPTYQELLQEMQAFLGKYSDKSDVRLLFFYSGHGYTSQSNQMAYIVPIDAGNPTSDYSSFISKAITLEHFHTWVRQFKARHFLAVFDSCFSGAIFTTKSPSDNPKPRPLGVDDRWKYLTRAIDKRVRQFISAGGPNEELPAKSSFVPFFIEGLKGGASSIKDGYVTGKELGVFLERTVSTYRDGKQNPVSGVSRDADFIFGDLVFQYDPSQVKKDIAALGDAEGSKSESNSKKPDKVNTPTRVVKQPDSLSEECKYFDCSK